MEKSVVTIQSVLNFLRELEKEDPRALSRELVVHDSRTGTESEVKALIDVDYATLGLCI